VNAAVQLPQPLPWKNDYSRAEYIISGRVTWQDAHEPVLEETARGRDRSLPAVTKQPTAIARNARNARKPSPDDNIQTTMKSIRAGNPRLIIGIILVILAVLLFLFIKEEASTAGAILVLILGLISLAMSRK
jgi:hypothetical protein